MEPKKTRPTAAPSTADHSGVQVDVFRPPPLSSRLRCRNRATHLDLALAQPQHGPDCLASMPSQLLMPLHTPCERCQRVGLVRLERIITGTSVTLSYYCG